MTQAQTRVPYSYLKEQFVHDPLRTNDILADISRLVETGDYTLGEPVRRFEEAFAQKFGVKHAIGVSNGTDALFLAMKAAGWNKEAQVITPPNSFLATTGAILQLGATPVFRDVGPDYLMQYRPPGPQGVLTVDLTGNVSSYDGWGVIHDAAQAIGAEYRGKSVAAMGQAACFSLHPLKNVNVWGDGGVVTTNNDDIAQQVRLLRNHGLMDRDTCVMPGYNHRLSSIQAIVAYHVLQDLDWITGRRIENARRYDEGLKDCPGIIIPPRDPGVKQVFHTYVVQVDESVPPMGGMKHEAYTTIRSRRDNLVTYLGLKGIEAKVHYPVPIHLQPGFASLGYREGDFPMAEAQARRIVSLPIHQYLTPDQIDYTIEVIRGFYAA